MKIVKKGDEVISREEAAGVKSFRTVAPIEAHATPEDALRCRTASRRRR